MADETPVTANDHNVYVLGAGFAQEAGLPVTENFLTRMRDAAAAYSGDSGSNSHAKYINKVLAFRLRSTSAAYRVPLDADNIEELFSLAAASSGSTGRELEDAMSWAIALTLEHCRKSRVADPRNDLRLVQGPSGWIPPANWPMRLNLTGQGHSNHCPPYSFYAATMCGYKDFYRTPERKDTVITFNYDTVLEDAMHELEMPFSYGFYSEAGNESVDRDKSARFTDAPDAVKILKLHGSVNWGIIDDNHKLSVFGSFGDLAKSTYKPALAPPTWRKGWGRGHPINYVWDKAVEALTTATRVVVIGYSMPQIDTHFRYLLASGLQNNISLRRIVFVNPMFSEDAENKHEYDAAMDRLVGEHGLLRSQHLRQNLIELLPVRTQDLFFRGLAHIGRTVNKPGATVADAAFRFSHDASNTLIY